MPLLWHFSSFLVLVICTSIFSLLLDHKLLEGRGYFDASVYILASRKGPGTRPELSVYCRNECIKCYWNLKWFRGRKPPRKGRLWLHKDIVRSFWTQKKGEDLNRRKMWGMSLYSDTFLSVFWSLPSLPSWHFFLPPSISCHTDSLSQGNAAHFQIGSAAHCDSPPYFKLPQGTDLALHFLSL